MASVTIRNLDPQLKVRLRLRAALNDRSMEEELREILREVLGGTIAEALRPRPNIQAQSGDPCP